MNGYEKGEVRGLQHWKYGRRIDARRERQKVAWQKSRTAKQSSQGGVIAVERMQSGEYQIKEEVEQQQVRCKFVATR